MLFKGNSSRLELLIGKIQAHKEPSQEEHHKSKGMYVKMSVSAVCHVPSFLLSRCNRVSVIIL